VIKKFFRFDLQSILSWAVVLTVAAFFRLWMLDSLPGELHRDEASIGYNAYGLLMAGHDEYGVAMPFNFRAFGEYKLPGLIYLTVPFIYFFGLTEWAIRLPTALAGILTIPVFFWYIRELGYSKRIAYIGTILLTLSFWHISQSRNVYEPMVGLLWSTLAISTWLKAQRQPVWAIASIGFYLLSSVFYNVPWILLPIVFVAISFSTHTTNMFKKKFFIGALALVAVCGIGVGVALQGVNESRSSVTVFNNQELTEKSTDFLFATLVAGVPSKLARVVEYPLTLQLQTLFSSYLSSFNPAYLFSLGDVNPWHNLRSIFLGNFNPVLLLPMLAGIFVLTQQWHKPSSRFLAILIVLTPVVSGLTVEAPITNRLLDFHLALVILAAVGADYLLSISTTNSRKFLFAVVGGAYLAFFCLFFMRYYFTYNYTLDYRWNPGIKSMFKTLQPLEESYDVIYVHGWDLSYIFMAFFYPLNPTEFADSAQRYVSGFDTVGQFKKYYFESPPTQYFLIGSDYLYKYIDSNKGILFAVREEQSEPLGKIVAQKTKFTGKILWTFYELTLEDLVSFYQKQPATPENQAIIAYLISCHSTCDKTILEPFLMK